MLKATRLCRVQCLLWTLILISAFLCSQSLNAQGAVSNYSNTVTINETNATLKSIFRIITKQTNLKFLGSSSSLDLSEKHSINVKNATVDQVLYKLLKGKGLSWSMEDGTIIIKKSNEVTNESSKIKNNSDSFITVIGIVSNERAEPIAGATVLIKNTQLGTTTNADGSFRILGAKSNAVIVITNIGYLTKEIAIRGKGNIGTIQLGEYVGILDETVVVAYGTTTKRLNTGNVVSIKAEDIEKQPVNNPLYALQGRVAGLQVTPTTGLAGGSVNLQIRGNNSLTFTTSPLIVVDGLPIAPNIPSLGGAMGQLSSLNFINPNDIESIDVLKDADATSIYGSRGANGVVLITMKKGKVGQTKVEINAQTGWADVTKKVKVFNTSEYLQMRKEAYANDGVDFITTFPFGLPEQYKYLFAPDLVLWKQNRYTDWQKVLIGGTASYNDIQGSISGGASTVQYIVGGNFHKETTVFPGNNDDQKGNAHISLTGNTANQKLKATVSASYMADHNTLPGIDLTNQALILAPNAPDLYKDGGTLNWEPIPSGASSWANPLAELYRPYDAKVNNLVASADIGFKLFPFLALKTQVGYNKVTGSSFKSGGSLTSIPPEQNNSDLIFYSNFNTNGVKNLSIEPQININTHILKGTLNALIGGSIQNTSIESQNIEATGFKSDNLIRNLASATSFTANNASSQYKYNALFARLNYNWKNKYLINLTARRDGSSRFGSGKQFGNFGSVGAAWIFTQENFSRKALPFMSYGKLRFSYGTTGNDNISDYAYLERYQPITGVDSYQGASGLSTTGIFNAYYHWESTKKLELGIETGFLKDRLLFSASYYRNRSNNQLLSTTYPSTVGPGSAVINLPAVIQNMGLEFTMSSINIKTGNFSWTTSANFTRNRNKIVSFPNLEQSSYYSTYEVGQPFYGVVKLFNAANVDPITGRYQFTTIDGKKVFDPNDASRLDGGKYLRVMTTPKFYGGISNSFTWKGLSLDVFFQFTKQIGINPLNDYYQTPGLAPLNLPTEFLSRWHKNGDLAAIQKITGLFDNDLYQSGNWLQNSNEGYVNASFIRMKNLSLSYIIPELWKHKMNIKNLRVYLQGQNLFTITKYKGLDPETQSMSSLPPLRVITTGIQITL